MYGNRYLEKNWLHELTAALLFCDPHAQSFVCSSYLFNMVQNLS